MFQVIEIFQPRGISKYFLTGLKEHTVLVVFDFSHTFFTLVLPSVFTVLGATPHTRQVTPLQSVGVIIFVSTPEMCLVYDKFLILVLAYALPIEHCSMELARFVRLVSMSSISCIMPSSLILDFMCSIIDAPGISKVKSISI